MGCDIHAYREKFVDGSWLTADPWTPDKYEEGTTGIEWEKRAYTRRNYDLFGLLSKGVRREFSFSLAPRGLPFDMCREVNNENDKWGVDGHSHSYLFLHELKSLRKFCDTNSIKVEGMKDREELKKLRASVASGNPDWDLLYPYCAMTNAPNAEKFEIDVPLNFKVGACLDKLIASFNGVDGDNHRLVFWFDS